MHIDWARTSRVVGLSASLLALVLVVAVVMGALTGLRLLAPVHSLYQQYKLWYKQYSLYHSDDTVGVSFLATVYEFTLATTKQHHKEGVAG